MGVRIRKVMGYGLDDVQHDEKGYNITDPRINLDSKLFNSWDLKVEDYIEWLDARKETDPETAFPNLDRVLVRDMPEKEFRMWDTFVWQGEWGIPRVLVLTPLTMNDWRRHDDAIDYVEETYLREYDEQQVNRVHVLPHGIYPWNGSYMDRRTGERIKEPQATLWRRRYFTPNITDENRESIAKALGFVDFAEADATYGPIVPEEVRDLAEYGELFTDPDQWKQLKPLLYIYWS